MWRLKKKLISKLYFTQLCTLTYDCYSIGYTHMLMIWKLSRSDFPSYIEHLDITISNHLTEENTDHLESSSLIWVVLETPIWVTSIKEIYYIHIKNWIAPRHNAPVKSTTWFTSFHYYNTYSNSPRNSPHFRLKSIPVQLQATHNSIRFLHNLASWRVWDPELHAGRPGPQTRSQARGRAKHNFAGLAGRAQRTMIMTDLKCFLLSRTGGSKYP